MLLSNKSVKISTVFYTILKSSQAVKTVNTVFDHNLLQLSKSIHLSEVNRIMT